MIGLIFLAIIGVYFVVVIAAPFVCMRVAKGLDARPVAIIIGDRVRQHKLASGSWWKSNTRKEWRIALAPSHACFIAR